MKKSTLLLFLFLFSCFYASSQLWIQDINQAKAVAQSDSKLILIDFYADWCGPCKQMDLETWSDADVKQQMQKTVNARIDIDKNKTLASFYGVKAIPTVVLADNWGNVIHKSVGYNSAAQVKNFLADIPENIEPLNAPLRKLDENEKDADALFDAALAYQEIGKTLPKKGKNMFLNESNAYFAKAGKFYKKDKNSTSLENIDLMKCYNKIIKGQSKSALKELAKMDTNQMQACNKALACFVMASGYMQENDIEHAQECFKQLETCDDATKYAEELKSTYSELAEL